MKTESDQKDKVYTRGRRRSCVLQIVNTAFSQGAKPTSSEILVLYDTTVIARFNRSLAWIVFADMTYLGVRRVHWALDPSNHDGGCFVARDKTGVPWSHVIHLIVLIGLCGMCLLDKAIEFFVFVISFCSLPCLDALCVAEVGTWCEISCPIDYSDRCRRGRNYMRARISYNKSLYMQPLSVRVDGREMRRVLRWTYMARAGQEALWCLGL
ncbi:hypothetical protein AG1IA_03195 [Rhizoctonia solani AG-1 IA]|uniref:Uncharacterized protein n=1 Tax=Thanatephorus cucumeris (strain AG1-IA) TaxID=983506 RepID=L8WXS8_THACA|nr:hypothetical protein AG1IA_03195 [Rhizoctonia solani AG-1 IA]